MSDVYFSKNIDEILSTIDFSKLNSPVGIKVHFGEAGCTTFINPQLVQKVYNKIKGLGKKVSLIECNVLYKGSRTNRTDHLKLAAQHGFGEMDIDILDGDNGEDFIEINGCKIGKGIEKYQSLIILSHFKGHEFAGFGGAIKNVAMGLGSRAGKLYMHSTLKPSINETCISCGACLSHCNANAITLTDGKAKIDDSKCEGCAMCIAVCNQKAVEVPWAGRTFEDLQKRIAEYAAGALSNFKETIFINVLEKITAECDCEGHPQNTIMDDVGILYSTDMVAIDKASIDLANKYSDGKFASINPIDMIKQIDFAQELNLGNRNYNLIDIK